MNAYLERILREEARTLLREAMGGMSPIEYAEIEEPSAVQARVQTHAKPTKDGLSASIRKTKVSKILSVKNKKLFCVKDSERKSYKSAVAYVNKTYAVPDGYRFSVRNLPDGVLVCRQITVPSRKTKRA